MKKKILIVGSIADFGGREVEVKNIVEAVSKIYDVKLMSTIPMTEKSMAVHSINCQWTTIQKELYNSNVLLKGLSFLSKKLNRSNLPSYLLVNNKISNVFFNFSKKNLQILKKEIASVDVVLFCGILTSGFLKEIISYSLESNKPFVLRTTGTIKSVPEQIKDLLSDISLILVHSHSNAIILRDVTFKNVRILDQTTLEEESLIDLAIHKSDQLTFGYIGRFSNEKGIVELLEIFKKQTKILIVAGNGPLLEEVKERCVDNSTLEYIGEISTNKIAEFFNRIDVLIIPSFEESGPLVGIEAMAAGKIIVSTKVGAMEDRLGQTANQFWFDINDAKSLLRVISIIENLNKDTVVTIREELRAVYKTKYSQKEIAKNYLDQLDTVFKKKE